MFVLFFFNDTATTEIYTLSLHDALPILILLRIVWGFVGPQHARFSSFIYSPVTVLAYMRDLPRARSKRYLGHRSEEHTSELQSRQYLVCRLLLEKKKKNHHLFLLLFLML